MTKAQTFFIKVKTSGLLGHKTDKKWNKETRTHDCCGSRTPWRHKVACTLALGNGTLP
jgi:hypothetical protein